MSQPLSIIAHLDFTPEPTCEIRWELISGTCTHCPDSAVAFITFRARDERSYQGYACSSCLDRMTYFRRVIAVKTW